MDDRDRDEMEAMDSGYVMGENWPAIVSDSVDIGHRMRYMRKRNLGLRFLRVESKDYLSELSALDPDLPAILGWMVSEAYLGGTPRIDDIIDNLESVNPLRYPRPAVSGIYREKVGRFLESVGAGEDNSLDRVPVGRNGCAEVWKAPDRSFEMRLVLQIRV